MTFLASDGSSQKCSGPAFTPVSTNDQQTLLMQIRAMREHAAKGGWIITMQVKEVGSGVSQRERREKLLVAARRREIDVVLVWRLDRFRLAPRRLDLTAQPAQAMARLAVRILSATPSVYDQDTSRCQAWAYKVIP